MPDTELLPKIADFFGVSIDSLFGRTNNDSARLPKLLCEKLISSDNRMTEAFDICWTLERALFGESKYDGEGIREFWKNADQKEFIYSRYLDDSGFTLMNLVPRLPYFFIAPDVPDFAKTLLDGIDYRSLFMALSDPEFFDALIFLNTRDASKAFTPNLLIKKFGMTFDRAMELIKAFEKYRLINVTQIEMDDVTQEIYTFRPSPSFIALLIMAREFISNPSNYSHYMGGRKKPYLN